MEEEKDNFLVELYASLKYSNENFDKYMIYISSGAIGIFLTVSDKIVPLSTAIHKYLFLFSLYFLGATIILGLIGHFISAQAIAKSISIYNKTDLNPFDKLAKKANKWIVLINILSITTLLIGLLLFVLYLQNNLFIK